LPGLHALRMIAALTVFVLHALFYSGRFGTPMFEFAGKYFALSVQLFYLVSAFALMHSTRVYAHQPDWISHFYQKRFWRIAPLFYAIAIVSTTGKWLRHGTLPSLPEIALNLVFLNNLLPSTATSLVNAGWSVSVEMLFYMAFPLIFLHIRSLKSAVVLTAASIVIAQVARVYLEQILVPPMYTMAHYSIAMNLPYFSMGVAAYLSYEHLRATPWSDPRARLRTTLRVHVTFALSIATLLILITHFDRWLRAHGRVDEVVWGLIFMLLTIWVTVRPVAMLRWAPIQFLGERSYSLYLLHPIVIALLLPVTGWVFSYSQPRLGEWAVAPTLITLFVPLVLLATVSYALIERPGMDFGRWLRQRLKSRETAVVQVTAKAQRASTVLED